MHSFDYKEKPAQLLSPEVVRFLGILREAKGRQSLLLETQPDVLSRLMEVSKVQSIGSSNRIEGIFTSDDRLKALVNQKTTPRNRSEEEIMGYREALSIIHESYDYIAPTSNSILQMHKILYSFTDGAGRGEFKKIDNIIAETGADGTRRVRFQPVPAFLTADAVSQLCAAYGDAIIENRYDPLLLAILFVFDFLCIHPFSDGNGRMSRLIMLLLFYRSDFMVGKYISIEMLIEKSKEQYYETLRESSVGWHEGDNTAEPFVRYMLGILVKAYNEFDDRSALFVPKQSKGDRVRSIVSSRLGKFTKRDICMAAPDVSESTIEIELASMLAEGLIEKIGSGRGTCYVICKHLSH